MFHRRNLNYLWSLFPGILVITGNLLGAWWVALNTVFSLIILAVLEFFIHENKKNESGDNPVLTNGILIFHIILQTGCILSMFWSANYYHFNIIQYLLLAFSTGIHSGSSAIVVAHELIHRKNKLYRMLGKYLLFTAGNIYFFIDHLKVHHKRVGTEMDSSTSRYGENLYRFFIRSTKTQIQSAYKEENKRLKMASFLEHLFRNYVTGSMILQFSLWLVIVFFFSPFTLGLYIFQCLVANFLLEFTTYIEHYGLTRNENERVSAAHSWQTDKVISRFFLIDLSRHADHHYYASRPYHTLRSHNESPVLPGGYVTMLYYAIIPPLFFKKMHSLMPDKKQ